MADESDRDILIDLRAKVTDMHFHMTQPGGKVPLLETKLDDACTRLSHYEGAVHLGKWLIGLIVVLVAGIGGVLLEHILKGGK